MRLFTTTWLLALLLGALPAAAAAPSQTGYDLRPHRTAGEWTEVKLTFSAKGTLGTAADNGHGNAPEGHGDAPDGTVPISAASRLLYDEHTLEVGRKSARHYRHCDADLSVGEHRLDRTLRAEHHTVLCEIAPQGARIQGLAGPLSRDELDLLETHGNSLLVDGLLPDAPAVKIGERWTPDSPLLAQLLNLDRVDTSDLFVQLVEVNNGLAHLRLAGTLQGECAGSSSEIRLKGDLRFDLHWRRISWCHLQVHEVREAGVLFPRLDVAAELRMLLRPGNPSPQLSLAALNQARRAAPPTTGLVDMDGSRLGFRWLHDRDWHVINERPSSFVMRLVRDGDAVAQCTVSQLPQLAAGKQLSLEDFQAEVQRALGERFSQWAHASQDERPDGCRVLRADAIGDVSGVPIRWIYYNLQHPDGQRAALVFTLKESNSDQFGQADQLMAKYFQFVPPAPSVATRPDSDS